MSCLAQDTTAKEKADTIRVGGMIIIKEGKHNEGEKNGTNIVISNHHKRKPSNISTNWVILDLGFSKTEIAEVRKVFGVVMSMTGVFLGGWAIARYGLMIPLMIGALAGPISNLVFVWLAGQGAKLSALFVAIGVDNIASGFAGTCLIAYMSSLTSAGFTATQYALFSSLYSLPGKLIASQSGRIVEEAARSANEGGVFMPLMDLVVRAPAISLAEAAQRIEVSARALGAGYIAFFLYSFLIGLVAVIFTAMVAKRTPSSR